MVEHQSAPGRRMAARMTTQTGMLYESLGGALRIDGRFPALLAVVVYAGADPWNEAVDLMDAVEASAVPGVLGASYRLLDLGRIASDDSEQRNRFHLLARLTWADSVGEAAQLLMDARGWLDLAAEDEQDLFRDCVNWLYALEPDAFAPDWDPHERKSMEELMGQLSPLQINAARLREQHIAEGVLRGRVEGRAEGRAEGTVHERAMLARQAARRFGAGFGRRGCSTSRSAPPCASTDAFRRCWRWSSTPAPTPGTRRSAGWARRCARSRIPSNWIGSGI